MRIACKLVLALTVCSLGRTLSEEEKDAEITDLNPSGYGVDVSFAMQHSKLRDGPLGDKQAEYETYMDGCRERYESYDCERSEYERLEMNLKQPPAMEVSCAVLPKIGSSPLTHFTTVNAELHQRGIRKGRGSQEVV